MSKKPSLSHCLKTALFPSLKKDKAKEELKELELRMLRIQQGIWHRKARVILAFEGFDAAGKGGAIRRITKLLDPRGVQVVPVGPPTAEEQGRHWLYRFWRDLPAPGKITIFDRSWYGRVLVERVDKLIPPAAWKRAYAEINVFEEMLVADGVELTKIFLAIHPEEQLRRFEERLGNPYKQWKLGLADVKARAQWNEYVEATDRLLEETHTKICPWYLIPADDKRYTRVEVLRRVTSRLADHADWIEGKAEKVERLTLKEALKKLGEEKI